MKLTLQEYGGLRSVPNEVCSNCHKDLSTRVSHGAKLRIQQKQVEQRRVMLWKSRVSLVKQARNLMTQKAFSEAAVAYEKYLRVIEMAYDVGPGYLSPEHFKNSGRQQELTVIASVYWDLLRIYDTSPRYGDRQRKAAQKLAQFSHFTPIHANILQKAKLFQRSAKNPVIIRKFIKSASKEGSRCFIASAAFNNTQDPTIDLLRLFRAQVLTSNELGRYFIISYYQYSPNMADFLHRHSFLKPIFRLVLRILARSLRVMFRLQTGKNSKWQRINTKIHLKM